DIRVCGRSATFGVLCRRVGVPLIDGGTVRLPRVIGLGRALDMVLTGRAVSSDEALQWGLVTKVVEDGEADIRVCGRSATFGVFCRRVGVPLIDGGTVRLPRVIGLGRALDMVLTGRAISCDEALQWGLVTKVVEDGEALNCALQLAKQIISNPYNCMLADRRSVMASFDLTTDNAMAFEFNSCSVIPEAMQG
ncbi:enoyl-CoA hydratase/isomerase family protein, partial [Teladorsagia circumcincta]